MSKSIISAIHIQTKFNVYLSYIILVCGFTTTATRYLPFGGGLFSYKAIKIPYFRLDNKKHEFFSNEKYDQLLCNALYVPLKYVKIILPK